MMIRKTKEEKGTVTISLKMIIFFIFMITIMFVCIDLITIMNMYDYINNHQKLANYEVYDAVDEDELYIDETLGRDAFESYLNRNLDPDKVEINISMFRIIDDVKVVNFEIYNTNELPAISPSGKTVTKLSVYSEIEINIKTILIGKFTTVKFNMRMMTDVPDRLLRIYHP